MDGLETSFRTKFDKEMPTQALLVHSFHPWKASKLGSVLAADRVYETKIPFWAVALSKPMGWRSSVPNAAQSILIRCP